MARPQVENGHTQIANEILEHLMMIHLPSNQWQIVICIIRKTYGYHKKVDYIANCQIIESTGLCKSVVSRALACLENSNIVVRNGKNIGIQKDWERWNKLAESSTKVSGTANKTPDEKLAIQQHKLAILQPKLAESSTKVSSPLVTQKKETIQKKLIQKKEYGEFKNVFLSDDEFQKLTTEFNGTLDGRIKRLSLYIESTGKKYKSHYATILNWAQKDEINARARPVQGRQSGNGTCTANEMDADEIRLGLRSAT